MAELQSVLSSLPQIAFMISNEGQIEYVNQPWFEYSHSKTTFPEVHPDDNNWSEWKRQFIKGIEFSSEVRIRHLATAEFRYFMLRAVPVKNGQAVTKWVGTFTDIQAQKAANEVLERKVAARTKELSVKNEELEFRNHELQQFSWVVSHDLKEPVRKIELFVKIIQERYLLDDQKAIHYAERTVRAAQRMSKLINDLIDYARLSSNTSPEKTDLNSILKEVMADLDYITDSKDAKIICGNLPEICCIPSQLRQVFQNLLSNSLKFSRDGISPEITINAEIIATKEFNSEVAADGQFCRITFSDNGIGFDEKYLEKIFIIFQSLNDRSRYEGTGIGLAIAKKIIEKHNGLITARSKSEQGATFIIVLPL